VRLAQAEFPKPSDILFGIGPGLLVVRQYVIGIEMLAAGMRDLVQHPGMRFHGSSRLLTALPAEINRESGDRKKRRALPVATRGARKNWKERYAVSA
jgi:hypothetical protein